MGSFDRKVERNQKKMYKSGKGPAVKARSNRDPRTALGPKGDGEIFKGRKIILPVVLALLAVLYGVIGTVGNTAELSSTIFWLTIVLYLLLALMIFLRRPYLRIDRNWLYTSKYNRDKIIEANNISKIKVSKNRSKITIIPKSKDVNWVFSRSRNLFDTQAMAAHLEQYAKVHHVAFETE